MPFSSWKINLTLLEKQYSTPTFRPESGLSPDELRVRCEEIFAETRDGNPMRCRAAVMAFILKNARLEVYAHCPFAGRLDFGDILQKQEYRLARAEVDSVLKPDLREAPEWRASKAFISYRDVSHTCPDWKRYFTLGFPGILAELRARRADGTIDADQAEFLDGCIVVHEAILTYLRRLADEASAMSDGDDLCARTASVLTALSERAPQTTHEAMHLIWTVYHLQTHLESTYVRSVGQLDDLLLPFWQADRAAGWTDAQLDDLLRYFLLTFRAFNHANNIPFYLGGTDADGHAMYNELTMRILQVYDGLGIFDPKIQLRWHPDLPGEIPGQILDMIRRGHSSFVIMNDAVVIDALTNIGIDPEDAAAYAPVGCYEPCAFGELPRTTAGKVTLAKPVEWIVSGGVDPLLGKRCLPEFPEPADFDEFFERYDAALAEATRYCMHRIDTMERADRRAHPSPIFSAGQAICVRRAKDAYDGGMKYNNSSINVFGIATAVDSLIAVKKLVYEEKALSLSELAAVLRDNWQGHEELRRRCLRYPKYGNGDPECDALAGEIMGRMARRINGVPNRRGGIFRMGTFSINWYTEFGASTGATPDGRFSGAPISKNMSAAVGRDKNGITGLIRSATVFDYRQIPNGTALDAVLHSSAVSGEDGMNAMRGLLQTFMQRGGIAIQLNVMSAEELRKAQKDPDSYRNLQVRLCGWNVRFTDLTREVQNEFIRMSERGA